MRSALAGYSGLDDDGNPPVAFGVAESTYQCPVTAEALCSKFLHAWVGRIRWHADVLPTCQIERDHELFGGTHLGTPLSNRVAGHPAMAGRLWRASLFEEV